MFEGAGHLGKLYICNLYYLEETLPSWYTILLIITHILLLQIYTVTPYPCVQLRLLMMGECSARNI
jgi:hypothetical protein